MTNLQKQLEQFHRETGITLEFKDGNPYYGRSLDLRGTGVTSLPDNLTVGGYLDLSNTGITTLPDNLTVGGGLDLRGTGVTTLPDNLTVGGGLYLSGTGVTSLPDNLTVGGSLDLEDCTQITSLPDNLTVGGSLDLRGTGITTLPDNLTVGGCLDLSNTGITTLPDNLTVGGYLDLRGTDITSLPDNLTVGGSLYLEDCTQITSLPDNLTVGGGLYLRGTDITSLPDNLTVGGGLYLRGTGVTSLPDNLTVGGGLDLSGTGITDTSKVNTTLSAEARRKISEVQNRPVTWKWNDREYIKVDGMFTVVDSRLGNLYRVHKLNDEKQFYLITDGENHWAHGDTLREAKADLIFKISDRDTSEYKKLSLDDTLSFEEAIAAYRTITGACSTGTRDYIHNRLPKPHKDKYSIREIIELTKGEYGGSRFADFFKNK